MSTFTLKQVVGGGGLTPALYNQTIGQIQTAIRGLQDASASNGTVTSVGLTAPSIFSVSGSPVTSTGTLAFTLASQTANRIFASPNGSGGTPTFRAIVLADLPAITPSKGGNGLTALGTAYQVMRVNSGASANEYFTLTSANAKLTLTPSSGLLTFTIVESELNIANMTGTLPISRGGSGATTAQAAIKALTQGGGGTIGHVLTLDSSNNPVWSAPFTLANNSVTYAKFQQIGAKSIVGNDGSSTANTKNIEVSGNLDISSSRIYDKLSNITTVYDDSEPSDRTYGMTYCDTASGVYTQTLPVAGDCNNGDTFVYQRVGATNNVTIRVENTSDDEISGGTTTTTYVLARNNDCVWLQYVGVVGGKNTWRIINKIVNAE